MNATIKAPVKESGWSNLSPNKSQEYTVDDIIDAYEKGCADGVSIYLKKMRKDLKANLQNVLPIIEDFFNSINYEGAKCKFMFIRLSDINKFDFIIAIDEDAFFNDEICKPIYIKSFEVRKRHQNIHISFMPCGSNLNIETLNSDNFVAIYGTVE